MTGVQTCALPICFPVTIERYTEIIRSHFGVVSPDSRLQRPEYLGGSSVPVNIAPVAQTSASAISGPPIVTG